MDMTWISTVPVEWAGATALMADELRTWYELAIVEPKSTPITFWKPLPMMVTVVPPPAAPEFGETAVMAAVSNWRGSQHSAATGPSVNESRRRRRSRRPADFNPGLFASRCNNDWRPMLARRFQGVLITRFSCCQWAIRQWAVGIRQWAVFGRLWLCERTFFRGSERPRSAAQHGPRRRGCGESENGPFDRTSRA